MMLLFLEEFKDRRWYYRPEFNFITDNNLHQCILQPDRHPPKEVQALIGAKDWTGTFPVGQSLEVKHKINDIFKNYHNTILENNISVEKLLKANWRQKLYLPVFPTLDEYFDLFIVQENPCLKNVRIRHNYDALQISMNNILTRTGKLQEIKKVLELYGEHRARATFYECFEKRLINNAPEQIEVTHKIPIRCNEVMRPFLKDCLFPLYVDLQYPEKARYTGVTYSV